jgi:hypothetical protein
MTNTTRICQVLARITTEGKGDYDPVLRDFGRDYVFAWRRHRVDLLQLSAPEKVESDA